MAVATPAPERAAGRKSALKRGLALPPPSPGAAPGFPVTDASHWDKAFRAVGRAGSPARRAALGKLLRKTASRFGKTAQIKGSWLDTGGGSKSMSNPLEFSVARKMAVTSASDVIVTRGADGSATIRHRNGGGEIARLRRDEVGRWVASIDGTDLAPKVHQRTALADAIGRHNRSAGTAYHRPSQPGDPLQGPPEQTPLMKEYEIPAIRALAMPANGDSDGPRATGADSGSSGSGGLGPRGQQIYKKLKAKGFPAARAMAFAKRAENMIARRSGK